MGDRWMDPSRSADLVGRTVGISDRDSLSLPAPRWDTGLQGLTESKAVTG